MRLLAIILTPRPGNNLDSVQSKFLQLALARSRALQIANLEGVPQRLTDHQTGESEWIYPTVSKVKGKSSEVIH